MTKCVLLVQKASRLLAKYYVKHFYTKMQGMTYYTIFVAYKIISLEIKSYQQNLSGIIMFIESLRKFRRIYFHNLFSISLNFFLSKNIRYLGMNLIGSSGA